MKEIVLCHRPGRCCPVYHESDDGNLVSITDDNDGEVKLTKEQFDVLKEKIINGEI